MMFGGLGLLGAFGLDITSKNFKAKADLYSQAIEKGKTKVLQEQVEEQVKNNEIKF